MVNARLVEMEEDTAKRSPRYRCRGRSVTHALCKFSLLNEIAGRIRLWCDSGFIDDGEGIAS